MKITKRTFFVVLVVVLPVLFSFFVSADHIQSDKDRWKPYYKDIAPEQDVREWLVPFKTADRKDVKTIAVVSVFGAARMSYVRGHVHTGLDMIPKKRTVPGEYTYVYVMAPGVVCSIHLGAPHTTVVVKHKLLDGTVMFSSYKHLGEIFLKIGQQVTAASKVGRLYTGKEALTLGGNYDHLHLEIRKQFDDYGVASWATLNREALTLRFHDPLAFMKSHVKK